MKTSTIVSFVAAIIVIVGSWYMYSSQNSAPVSTDTGNTPATVPANNDTGTHPVAQIGEHCGGNMTTAAVCASGAHCAPTPGSHLPFGDVGGTCVAD